MMHGQKNIKLSYFSMLYGFNATCFGSFTRSLHQADKTPQKNYYVSRVMLFTLVSTPQGDVPRRHVYLIIYLCSLQALNIMHGNFTVQIVKTESELFISIVTFLTAR